MTERLLDKLFRWGKEQPASNCYGFALSQLDDQQPEVFRDPNKIWEDCTFVAFFAPDHVLPRVMYLRTDLSVNDLNKNIDPSEVELIAFLGLTEYIGRADVVHVVANRPDVDGNIRHRLGYGESIKPIQLSEVIQYYTIRGHIVSGFSRKKRKSG